MARTANSQNVKRAEEGPDYNAVIGLVRGQIRTNESDTRSLAQDNSTLYKRIEKQHGVHRGAARTFATIDGMAPEKRTDYLRSLLGLLGFAGYDNFDDLVDRAQKPAGKKETKAKKPAPTATGPEGKNGNIEQADPDPEIEAQRVADAAEFDGDNVHQLPVAKK